MPRCTFPYVSLWNGRCWLCDDCVLTMVLTVCWLCVDCSVWLPGRASEPAGCEMATCDLRFLLVDGSRRKQTKAFDGSHTWVRQGSKDGSKWKQTEALYGSHVCMLGWAGGVGVWTRRAKVAIVASVEWHRRSWNDKIQQEIVPRRKQDGSVTESRRKQTGIENQACLWSCSLFEKRSEDGINNSQFVLHCMFYLARGCPL